MIKIYNCNSKKYLTGLNSILSKRREVNFNNNKIVAKIIKDIKTNKNKALLKYEKRFSKNSEILLSKKKINKTISGLDKKVKKAIDFAYSRIFNFHQKQLKSFKNIKYIDRFKNRMEYKTVPINSVGIYCPGNLPSTVLMNGIPAKIAKVKRIVLATPKFNGKLNPAVLYAAKKIGIKEIYCMGGAQAISSLAYIFNVNKIVGPGNRFVGPSEICVFADKHSNINQIATSLVSQAEHDKDSQCILVTKDKSILKKVSKKIKDLLKVLPRNKIAKQSLKNHGLFINVKTDEQAINVINAISTEHLELQVKNYNKYSKRIYNAGSICNGKFSPMCLSDFTVGTNHVLPTSGSARFSSGLNIGEFCKKISVVTLSKLGVEKIANPAITLSEVEELEGHSQSIKSRIRRN